MERNRFPTTDRFMKATGWLAGDGRGLLLDYKSIRLLIRQILPVAQAYLSVVEDEDEVWEAARPPRITSINLSLMTGKLIISEACSWHGFVRFPPDLSIAHTYHVPSSPLVYDARYLAIDHPTLTSSSRSKRALKCKFNSRLRQSRLRDACPPKLWNLLV